MIVNNAVRVIAGYHDQAPSTVNSMVWDKLIAQKFIDIVKTGTSVKYSWIQANLFYSQPPYGTSTYSKCLVLTHSGSVQNSRFEGFPGQTYARPDSSSKTILRFSQVSNGAIEPLKKESFSIGDLTFSVDVESAKKVSVPDYLLKAVSPKISVRDNAKVMVLRDGNIVSTSKGEIGDQEVEFSENDAVIKAEKWMLETYNDINIQKNSDKRVKVSHIRMAEVDLDGNYENEIEKTVAYIVSFTNTYNKIPVENFYTAIINNEGVTYSLTNWSEFEEVKVEKSKIDFMKAVNLISSELAKKSF